MLCYHKLGHLPVSNTWECTKDYEQRTTKTIFYPSLSTAYENNNLPCLLVTFNSFSRGISQCINISLSLLGFIQGSGGEGGGLKVHGFALYSIALDVLFFHFAWLFRIKTSSFREGEACSLKQNTTGWPIHLALLRSPDKQECPVTTDTWN